MYWYRIPLFLSFMLIFAAISGKPQQQPVQPGTPAKLPPLRIGVIGPLSGTNKFTGLAQLNGVRLAAAEANAAGGVNGSPVEVLEEDDRGLPEFSRSAATNLIQQGVVAILGAINSSCTIACMEQCAPAQVPILTSSSTATRVTRLNNHWVFRCIESDLSRMDTLCSFLVDDLDIKRIAVFHEDDDYGEGLKADLDTSLKKRYGLEISYAYRFKRAQRDFSQAFEEARQRNIQAVGLFGITSDNVRIATMISQQGYAFQLFSPDVNEKYLEGRTDGLEGLVATDSYYLLQDKTHVQDFNQRFFNAFQVSPDVFSGRAYDAAQILIQALRRSVPARGEALRQALFATENYLGLTGVFNFKSNGDVVKPIQVISIREGRFVPAREWIVRSGYSRYLVVLVPSLVLLSLVAAWVINTTRRVLQKRWQERALREFRPIRVNPYIVGNPIRDRVMFFGREDDFRFIRKNLDHGGSGICIVLCGDRRSGKTSILYQILDGRLGSEYLPVLLDLQLYGTITSAETLNRRLGEDICARISRLGAVVPAVDGGAVTRDLATAIEGILRAVPGKKLILLFDEYEILENMAEQGSLNHAFFDLLAGLLERHPALSYVLTGSTRLEDRQKPFWTHLIAKSLYRKISYLTEADALRLIKDPLAGIVFYQEEIPHRIFRLTSGQPFYTQAICMNIVDHLNEQRRNLVTSEDLATVVEQLVENPLPQMLYSWDNYQYSEKLILSLLAEASFCCEPEFLTADEILFFARAQNYPIQLEIQQTGPLLENLFGLEILTKKGRGFRFRMDLFRTWIHHEHSPWQLIGTQPRG